MLATTGYASLCGRRIADMFAGTGVVSHHFRTLGAVVLSNDAELYSAIITRALTTSIYTTRCKELIDTLNAESTTQTRIGYVTTHYSPYNGNERMFFTEENAKRMDFIRYRIEELKSTLSEEEYTFLLASLLVSADAVSNVPAVYGCYLKNFKDRAVRHMTLVPVHTNSTPPASGSHTTHADVMSLPQIPLDIVYLDPPYNHRQYSKNYFPLNILAKTPLALESEPPLKGKTGIPTDCFLSPFCKTGAPVRTAFDTLFKNLNTQWIFISYSSEGLLTKDEMIECMRKYGEVSFIEREHKRFKSFEYNESKPVTEYIFCLHKITTSV
jgi:adenine-specific DNA-methyltransferase